MSYKLRLPKAPDYAGLCAVDCMFGRIARAGVYRRQG